MNISGYMDDLEESQPGTTLVDASDLLADESFWPSFLATAGGAESAPGVFGLSPADLDPFLHRLRDPLRWPVISLGLTGGHRLHIVVRNFEEDSGVDYVLQADESSESLLLAALEGHFVGPALAWPELIAASEQPDTRLSAAQRLLLLLPACADADRPDTALDEVTEALREIGARGALARVAAELLDSPYWPPCLWTRVDGALVCDSPYGARRPGGALLPASLRMVTHAFDLPASDS